MELQTADFQRFVEDLRRACGDRTASAVDERSCLNLRGPVLHADFHSLIYPNLSKLIRSFRGASELLFLDEFAKMCQTVLR